MVASLAVAPFTDKQMQATVDRVMPVPKDDKDHSRLESGRAKVIQLLDTAAGIQQAALTAIAEEAGVRRAV